MYSLLIYATFDGKFSPSLQISDLNKIQRARNNQQPSNMKKKRKKKITRNNLIVSMVILWACRKKISGYILKDKQKQVNCAVCVKDFAMDAHINSESSLLSVNQI